MNDRVEESFDGPQSPQNFTCFSGVNGKSLVMKNREEIETPGVKLPPPLIVLAILLVGLGLDYVFKTEFSNGAWWLQIVGVALVVLGLVLNLWSAVMYRKAKTNILPHTADSNLIEVGPFARSRNPIYLGMLVVFVGISLILNAPLALLFAPLAWLALRFYVIAREEAYLVRRFGDEYTSYQSRVRRWM
ncbi:MAG: isoprenylcysteine carboxylmethyltransferase family protein [Robiginitomaculum sp.]|nr:isoprenylcysteine carboxylmethyltransferase family protein [Robiginitomaculum sp.]